MKHRYLVEIDMDPMMTIDAASDVEAIQGAVWEMFTHLPRKAVQVTPLPPWGAGGSLSSGLGKGMLFEYSKPEGAGETGRGRECWVLFGTSEQAIDATTFEEERHTPRKGQEWVRMVEAPEASDEKGGDK